MLQRNDYSLDLQPGPWPESDIIGFVRGPEDEAYQPMYRVRKEEWEWLRQVGERQRNERIMSTLDVIERELKELQRKADEIVRDNYSFTEELRATAFNVSSAIGTAIEACKMPTTEKAAF